MYLEKLISSEFHISIVIGKYFNFDSTFVSSFVYSECPFHQFFKLLDMQCKQKCEIKIAKLFAVRINISISFASQKILSHCSLINKTINQKLSSGLKRLESTDVFAIKIDSKRQELNMKEDNNGEEGITHQ